MKTVLVTGGAKGIGRAIALKFAREGYPVCIDYLHSEAQAKQTVAEINKISKGFMVKGDVSKAADAEKIVEFAVEKMGGIGVLVNNAGIYAETPGKHFYELDEDEWDRVMDANVKGTWLVSKYAVQHMIKAGVKGSIVNISSISGLDAALSGAHYGASKAAVINLTKSFCVEVGKNGIRVNSIAPGSVLTDLLAKLPPEKKERMRLETPLQKLSTPENIADAVYAMATLENVNGQTLVVDGGRLKH